jgi:putative molybdopterin biosynthesis protein
LDYELEKFGIHPKEINGYLQEEYTHLAVSAAVASGRANCGMGIAAAARALNLDFVPLFKERYDLIIPKEYLGDDLLEPVFDVLDNKEFRSEIAAFPGYDISKMGEIVAELP